MGSDAANTGGSYFFSHYFCCPVACPHIISPHDAPKACPGSLLHFVPPEKRKCISLKVDALIQVSTYLRHSVRCYRLRYDRGRVQCGRVMVNEGNGLTLQLRRPTVCRVQRARHFSHRKALAPKHLTAERRAGGAATTADVAVLSAAAWNYSVLTLDLKP